ncbi:short-chain dehydrogenase [Caballeronia mineralivorans PML1(12)]|uniref:Short-chain dehydrogenase n=1 Tax=Caballeronia mineralivorans PML1(12) TaxID=908627 RepID=A0A0J1D4Q9_9BURK|nr:SDR family NAD(P)-dependent oxidoreductase [Caballeronia mineralivorans]KLU27694.1 short-chain dehydrogenase [Caballeronia mineralivorans PML1(12)]
MSKASVSAADRKAYIVTGPTSGIGRLAAIELAKHGMVILVGRNLRKLDEVASVIQQKKQLAISIACDLSDVQSVRRAAAEIIALNLPIAGLLNNAGIMQMRSTTNALGWDTTFATNHLGPFALTEALLPHLPDSARVIFVASGVEDPKRTPAKAAGFRGGRFISVIASTRGEWQPGGSSNPGFDAYATSKQCILAATMALARENPRLRINAIEPGFTPNTGLGRDANAAFRLVANYILPLLAPFIRYWSTPKRASRLEAKVLTNQSGQTGIYYDERGESMLGSTLVQDRGFQDRVVAETRALLSSV